MNEYNLILDTDSYKLPMFLAYPEDVEQVSSYAESRGGAYRETLQFGMQSYVRHLRENPVTLGHVEEAEALAAGHGVPFNKAGWTEIARTRAGHLPITIRSADEGMVIPTKNALASVQCEPGFVWLNTHVETSLLRHVWTSTTIATRIFNMKRGLVPYFEKTSDSGRVSPFAILDFSSRGVAGYDHNELGGAAYLAMFQGTDSLPAVRFTNHYYDSPMSGFSVPATEHSIMCAWMSDGVDTIRALLKRMGRPGGVLSIVGDTWDIYAFAKACAQLAPEFKAAGVTLVVRPDSGAITQVIRAVIDILLAGFGWTVNDKGFRVIDGAKVLWGDGIDEQTYLEPFDVAVARDVSVDSVMVGSGGGLMIRGIDRDLLRFAFKASAIRRRAAPAGVWEGIAKDPITDPGKSSKRGRQALIRVPGGLLTVAISGAGADQLPKEEKNLLRPRYRLGELLNSTTLDEVRERVDAALYTPAAAAQEAARVQVEHHA